MTDIERNDIGKSEEETGENDEVREQIISVLSENDFSNEWIEKFSSIIREKFEEVKNSFYNIQNSFDFYKLDILRNNIDNLRITFEKKFDEVSEENAIYSVKNILYTTFGLKNNFERSYNFEKDQLKGKIEADLRELRNYMEKISSTNVEETDNSYVYNGLYYVLENILEIDNYTVIYFAKCIPQEIRRKSEQGDVDKFVENYFEYLNKISYLYDIDKDKLCLDLSMEKIEGLKVKGRINEFKNKINLLLENIKEENISNNDLYNSINQINSYFDDKGLSEIFYIDDFDLWEELKDKSNKFIEKQK